MPVASQAILIEGQSAEGAPPGPVAADLLKILKRRRKLVFGSFAVTMLAATAFLLVAPSRYEAMTSVLVSTDDLPRLDTGVDAQGLPPSVRDLTALRQYRIDTQIELLTSRPVARKVVYDLALFDDPEFYQQEPGPKPLKATKDSVPQRMVERATDSLLSRMDVQQDGNTDLINVAVTSHSAPKAARIANKIASAYLETQIAERASSHKRSVDVLAARVEELRKQIVNYETDIAGYRAAHGIDAIAGTETIVAQASRLASELAATRGDAAAARARAGATGQLMSPLLGDLRGQESQIQRKLAELSTQFGSAHPDVQKATAELSQLRLQIGQESSRISNQLASEASAQGARESRIAGDLGSVKAQSMSIGMANVPLADLERNVEATRTVYLNLLTRLKQIRRVTDQQKAGATIAFQALVPNVASFPRPGQVLGTAAGASVLFGLILVLLAEALDRQVRTAEQVHRLTGLKTIGMIPDFTGSARDRPQSTFATVLNQPYCEFTEAIRDIESRLRQLVDRNSGAVILVTSPLPGDGKSTAAVGFVAAAVATRQSAVLVDFDLRPGSSGVVGRVPAEFDLLDYIHGRATLDQVIVRHPTVDAVHVIGVNSPDSDAGATLASPKVGELIAALRDRFDIVIINSPPILAVGDARILARFADATMLVLRWGRTSVDLLKAAVALLDSEIACVVFNRVDFEKHAAMAYGDQLQYYRYYRGRYLKDQRKTALRQIVNLRLLGKKNDV
jgi:succinoglycan biosynthesis transport protein ExoP